MSVGAAIGRRSNWWTLTNREHEILQCAVEGLNTVATAERLFLGVQTIKFHRGNLFKKLGARNMPHAVAIGYQTGLLALNGATVEHIPPLVVINGVDYVPAEKP